MNKYLCSLFTCIVTVIAAMPLKAGPADDLAAMQNFFAKRFSAIELTAHKDGAYALDEA
ncbi:MAG: hypothetical protein ACI9SC_003392, partial [Gammaproteobacteria bacterium]